ncbi:MAG: tetratricopeptide repeat protein [Rickettsiales bacterium]
MNQAAPSTRKLMKIALSAMDKNKGQQAFDALQEVIRLNPNHTEALHNLAMILHNLGHYSRATEYYQRAIQSDPTYLHSYIFFSKLLQLQDLGDQALQVAQLGTQVAAHDAQAHCNLVSLMMYFNQVHKVPGYLEQVLPNFPEHLELQQFYCIALKINNQRERADTIYQALTQKYRVPASFRIIYETYMPRFYRSSDEIDAVRAQFEASVDRFIQEKPQIDVGLLSNNPLFVLAFHNRDNKAILTKYTKMLRSSTRELNYVAPHCKAPRGLVTDKIRIGFISRHMHNHSVGNCYRGIILHLASCPDMDLAFFNVADVQDEKIEEIKRAAVPIVPLPVNIQMAQKTVADAKLDILIYPNIGMDATTNYMAMARLATHQVCLQGHPETTGIDTIDYLVSSRSYEPPHAEQNYTERLLCTDGIDTIFTRPKEPVRWLSREELNLPSDRTLYVCPMAIQKIHPDYDAVLAGILARDPKAVIVLFKDFMQQTASELLQQRLFTQCDPQRVILLSWMPLETLFSVLKQADAIIETVHFGGGTTFQYAFNFGLPVVTMPGNYARARVVYSYYTLMGIQNPPCADNLEDYVRRAVHLANDKAYAQRLSAEILQKNHLIFESAPYAPRIEKLMRDIMHQQLDEYKR